MSTPTKPMRVKPLAPCWRPGKVNISKVDEPWRSLLALVWDGPERDAIVRIIDLEAKKAMATTKRKKKQARP